MIVGTNDPADETSKLEGTWAVESAHGLDAPEEAVKRLKVIIRSQSIQFMAPGREKEKATRRERAKATFKLHPSQKPKAIDLTKDADGPTAKGIYELDGDTLKLAWRREGPRPTEFPMKRSPGKVTKTPSEQDDLVIMVLKKE